MYRKSSFFSPIPRLLPAVARFNEFADLVAVRQDRQFQVVGPAFAGDDFDELPLLSGCNLAHQRIRAGLKRADIITNH